MANTLGYNLPDRWINCPRKGQLIEDKFLPFKTPLCSKYDPRLEDREKFPPSLLLSISQNLSRPIGMVIDLTVSRRFYPPSEMNEIGFQHFKIPCEGHKNPPTIEQTQQFIQLSLNFFSSHREKSIGVHCTHGFNRTGFLIVSYLVEQEDWGLSAAVRAFSEAREPGIYKPDYLAELYRRYGDGEEEVPAAPERPPWCAILELGLELSTESESESSDGEGAGQAGVPAASRDILEEVPSIRALSLSDTHRGVTAIDLIHSICRLCGHKQGSNYNFPGSQPVTLDRDRLIHLHKYKYYVSWKADGTRYMLYIRGKGEVYLLRRDNRVFPVENMTFPHRKPTPETDHVVETLLDCEMVIESRPHVGRRPYLLLYDLVAYAGENKFGSMRHPERIKIIKKDIYEPRERASLASEIDKSAEPFSIRLKQFFSVRETGQIYHEFMPKLHHQTDGLIFSMDNQGYFPGRCEWLLKWKPLSLNSIDFRLNIQKVVARIGELAGKRYQFLVIEDGKRTEMEFFAFEKKSIIVKKDNGEDFRLEELDRKIVECTLEGNFIKILRIRTDKTKPNTFSTASNVFNSIKNPLGIEDLLKCIENIPSQPNTSHSVATKTSEMPNHRPTNSSVPPSHLNSHQPQKHRADLNHNSRQRKPESNYSQNNSEPNFKRPRLDSSGSD